MNYFNRGNIFQSLPPVTKNFLIITVIVYAVTYFMKSMSSPIVNVPYYMMLWNFQSPYFKPFQLITYMFMHGSLGHIFFNMFAVFMFGRILESVWGSKKFFTLYVVSGLGAALIHLAITYFQIQGIIDQANIFFANPGADTFWSFLKEHGKILDKDRSIDYQQVLLMANNWLEGGADSQYLSQANALVQRVIDLNINIPMVGASGAVFGILIAFAMMFPNVELMIIFLPIPIKAKYLVPIYAVIELFLGVANFQWDNVAHFAHLGGAIVGFILVKYWKKNQFQSY